MELSNLEVYNIDVTFLVRKSLWAVVQYTPSPMDSPIKIDMKNVREHVSFLDTSAVHHAE
jgi:hypothetical protein